jgi:hypothetical protein
LSRSSGPPRVSKTAAHARLAPYSGDWTGNRRRRRIVTAGPGKQLTGTITGAFMPRRSREHEVTRLLLTVAMATTRRAAGLSAGDRITAGGSC